MLIIVFQRGDEMFRLKCQKILMNACCQLSEMETQKHLGTWQE